MTHRDVLFFVILFFIILTIIILVIFYPKYKLWTLKKRIFPYEIEDIILKNNIKYPQFLKDIVGDNMTLNFVLKYKEFNERPDTFSMARKSEVEQMRELVKNIANEQISGDLIEAGVWRGGMGMWMKSLMNYYKINTTLWLFDVYGKFPEATHDNDKHVDPVVRYLFSNPPSIETVKNNFNMFGLLDDKIKFIRGDFKETMPSTSIPKISILRIDGDYYESTIIPLENYYFNIVSGGYVIIDDYNNGKLDCKKATDFFRETHGITNPIVSPNSFGAVYWKI